MIKKEIGCTTFPKYVTFPFVPCSACMMIQGDLDCIHFRNEVHSKMIYSEVR